MSKHVLRERRDRGAHRRALHWSCSGAPAAAMRSSTSQTARARGSGGIERLAAQARGELGAALLESVGARAEGARRIRELVDVAGARDAQPFAVGRGGKRRCVGCLECRTQLRPALADQRERALRSLRDLGRVGHERGLLGRLAECRVEHGPPPALVARLRARARLRRRRSSRAPEHGRHPDRRRPPGRAHRGTRGRARTDRPRAPRRQLPPLRRTAWRPRRPPAAEPPLAMARSVRHPGQPAPCRTDTAWQSSAICRSARPGPALRRAAAGGRVARARTCAGRMLAGGRRAHRAERCRPAPRVRPAGERLARPSLPNASSSEIPAASERRVYTVANVNRGPARRVDELPALWVEGEIGDLRYNPKFGFTFLTLRDPTRAQRSP